jgi:hypothetical protein
VPRRRGRRDGQRLRHPALRVQGTGAQQREAQPDGTLRNERSGRCLDAAGASSENGTRLIIYDCHGGANQRWDLP